MSNLPNNWEADIRQGVEEHIFDYDPNAWTAMEQLLEAELTTTGQAASDAVPKPGASSLSLGSLWIGISIIIGFAVLGWWMKPDTTPNVATLSSWPIDVSTAIEPVANTKLVTAIADAPNLQTVVPSATTESAILSTPLYTVLITQKQPKQGLPQQTKARSTFSTFDHLPTPTLPSELVSQQLPVAAPLQIIIPKETKSQKRRQRDRKTLFPDIIEHY